MLFLRKNFSSIRVLAKIYQHRRSIGKLYSLERKNHSKRRPNSNTCNKTKNICEEVENNATLNDIQRSRYLLSRYNILNDKNKNEEYEKEDIQHKIQKVPMVKEQSPKLTEIRTISRKKQETELTKIEPRPPPLPACYNSGVPELSLSFLEAAKGANKLIYTKSFILCSACKGGTTKIGAPKTLIMCSKCNGTGYQSLERNGTKKPKLCRECIGTKYVFKHDCKQCQNRGFKLVQERINVDVMPGVNNNDIIYVQNPGDSKKLAVRIKVQESNNFRRINNDIHTEKELTLTQAILGDTFRIRGIHDDIQVIVKPGTDHLSKQRFKGSGIKGKDGFGDHVVTFLVKMPKSLTPKQKSIVTMLEKPDNYKNE